MSNNMVLDFIGSKDKIRTKVIDGKTWFCGKDVCDILRMNTADGCYDALRRLKSSERTTIKLTKEEMEQAKDFCPQHQNHDQTIQESPENMTDKSFTNQNSSRPHTNRGGARQMSYINRYGLTRLAMRSDKPEAVKLQDWIIYDVIPQIEDTGEYKKPEMCHIVEENPKGLSI